MNHDPVTLPRPADAVASRRLSAGSVPAESGRHGVSTLEERVVIDELVQCFIEALQNWQDCNHDFNCPEWDRFAAAFAALDREIKNQPREES